MKIQTKLNPELNRNARVTKKVYEDIPRGIIVTINDIQYDYYGVGSHRYWATFNDSNYYFSQKELEGI